ncbi:DUF6233 domain-containing protein [Streptomyces sp. YS415]|uniref:DUF6233 domain-containing protein n=1 Tax=Streptomyces sp. YS415 TaxID=2944806 RepID=UPI0027E29C37|nr:DUF6233 domain-containing protein [Streptomyces sp. YS415]
MPLHRKLPLSATSRCPARAADCRQRSACSKGVPRAEALRALADRVDPCPHCRPDSELGILD